MPISPTPYASVDFDLEAVADGATTLAGMVAIGNVVTPTHSTDQIKITTNHAGPYVAYSVWGSPSPVGPSSGSSHTVKVAKDSTTLHEFGTGTEDGYAAARAAWEAIYPAGATLSGFSTYHFGFIDNPVADNTGGLSLTVESFLVWNESFPSLADSGGGTVFAPAVIPTADVTLASSQSEVFGPSVESSDPAEPQVEWNPYRPDVPHNLADQDPNTYDYLREQAEILREQHDVIQAGGTTFPWELSLKISDTAEFQLGALSRFYHPDYGILLARYVKFSDRWTAWSHAPVGHDLSRDDWVVTNRIEYSHWSRLAGVPLNAAADLADKYGWVLVQGRGLMTLRLAAAAVVDFAAFTWTATGKAGYGAGNVLGRLPDAEDAVAAGEADEWALFPGTWYCELGGVTDEHIRSVTATELTSIDLRLDAVELAFETQVIDYQPQIDAIEATVSGLQTGLFNESQQRALVDASFLQRIQLLEQANQAGGGPAYMEFYALTDRVTALEAVNFVGLAGRVTTLEGTVSAHTTQIAGLTSQVAGLLESVNEAGALTHVIDWLSDVDTSTLAPTDGQTLIWVAADSQWKPGDAAALLSELGDVDVITTPPSDGQSLVWDATNSEWIPGDVTSGPGGPWELIHASTIAAPVTNVTVTNLADYEEIIIEGVNLTLSGAGQRVVNVSIDNGATWYTTSGDYYVADGDGVVTASTAILAHAVATASSRTLIGRITGFNLANVYKVGVSQGGFTRFLNATTTPLNAIRLFATGGFNLTGGVVRVFGRRTPTAKEGTAFPSGPTVNQRFFRTDRGIEYYWDGTRWLSTQRFTLPLDIQAALRPWTATETLLGGNPFAGQFSIYVERFTVVTNNSATTAANYFTAQLSTRDGATAANLGAGLSGQGNTINEWVSQSEVINAVVASTVDLFVTQFTETGVASISATASITYRLIG